MISLNPISENSWLLLNWSKISSYETDFVSLLNFLDPAEPSISAEVMRHAGINELFYYCDIIPEPDTDYNYTIHWNIANETSTKSERLSFESMRFDKEFRKSTALTESKLKSSGVDTFPYIVCKILFLTASKTMIT